MNPYNRLDLGTTTLAYLYAKTVIEDYWPEAGSKSFTEPVVTTKIINEEKGTDPRVIWATQQIFFDDELVTWIRTTKQLGFPKKDIGNYNIQYGESPNSFRLGHNALNKRFLSVFSEEVQKAFPNQDVFSIIHNDYRNWVPNLDVSEETIRNLIFEGGRAEDFLILPEDEIPATFPEEMWPYIWIKFGIYNKKPVYTVANLGSIFDDPLKAAAAGYDYIRHFLPQPSSDISDILISGTEKNIKGLAWAIDEFIHTKLIPEKT